MDNRQLTMDNYQL